jgi:membrane protease YdiL (CAAX protease family)
MKRIFLGTNGHLRSGWKMLLFFIALQVATGLLAIPLVLLATLRHGDLAAPMEMAGPFLGVVAGLGVSALAVHFEQRSLRSLGLAVGGPWFRQAGLGVLLGALIMVLAALLLRAAGGFHWVLDSTGSFTRIALGFLLFLAVGVNEEVAFRGYPFQRLQEGIGAWPTQLIFADIFAAIHLSNPGISTAGPALKAVTTFNIGLAAVLLGLCYLRTRSLALPIGVHLGWNWAQGNLLGFGVSGTTLTKGFWTPVLHNRPEWLTGGVVGIEGSLLCTLVCGAAILGLLLLKPRVIAEVDAAEFSA